MRILGIDYGSKRIGIAVSDEGASFAIPRTVLLNDAKILDEIGRIVLGESISKIVIGDPGDNPISTDVRSFVTKLEEKFSLPVVLEKEFMTSSHVSQFQGRKPIARLSKQDTSPKRDDSAAALILQRYLDRKI